MRVSTVREFRDRATTLLRSNDPVLVTRHGRVAGVFLPWRDATLPVDMKRELFALLSAEIGALLKRRKTTEREIQRDFAQWRRQRRETGSRR